MAKDKRAEVFGVIFALVLTGKVCWQACEAPEHHGSAQGNDLLHKGEEVQFRDYLSKDMYVHGTNKQMGCILSFLMAVVEQILLKAMSMHKKDKSVSGNSQHHFAKSIPCLINRLALRTRQKQ